MIHSTCPYCGVGCGVSASENSDIEFNVAGDKTHPANSGRLCVKGSALSETLSLDNRLLYPKVNGQRRDWDSALNLIAEQFRSTQQRYGRNSVALYVSGQLLTEDYYVANKLAKGALATGNIDTNSRLCMASAVVGHQRAFGEDIVPGCYEDFDLADLIVFVGSNAAWTHPVLFQRALARRAANPKTKIVVIDPRRTASAEEADLFLPIRAGSDGFLFNGLLHYLKREDAIDWAYLAQHCDGWVEAFAAAKSSAPSIPAVATACDIAPELVAQFFSWFAKTAKTVSAFTMGINQSEQGSDNVNAIINAHLVTGRVGKPGASPFSLTGQPNAMGGREVGGLATQLAAHRSFSADDCKIVKKFWNLPHIAEQPGLKAVDMFDAVYDGKIKALWILGTNPAVSMPNAKRVREALKRCDFVVISDVVQNNDSMAFADVALPALAWSEKDGTVTNSERCISRQRAFRSAPGEAKADWWALAQVGQRLGFNAQFNYQHAAQIFREHCALSSLNTSRVFNLNHLANISDDDYRTFKPQQWPAQQSRVFGDGIFARSNQRAQCIPITPQALSQDPKHMRLNTGRLRDQWHTMTRTGEVAKLRQHAPIPVLQLHADDALQLQLRDGELVADKNAQIILRAQISDSMRRGESFAAMHWTKVYAASAVINENVAAIVDRNSGEPAFKHSSMQWQAWRPRWQALLLSREKSTTPIGPYFSVQCLENGYATESAGDDDIDWINWFSALSTNGETISFNDAKKGEWRAAHLHDGVLSHLLLLTQQSTLPSYQWLASLLGKKLADFERRALLSGLAPNGASDDSALICSCFNVRQKAIQNAIAQHDLDNVAAIGAHTKAGTNCGSCKPELRKLLQQVQLV